MNAFNRFSILALAILLGIGAANAKVRFGVKAGVDINKIHISNNYEDTFSSDNRCGFTGGAMAELGLPLGFAVDLSLMYSRMNSQVTYYEEESNGNVYTYTSNKAKNFFNIPLNVKYKLSLPVVSSVMMPYLFTGPDFAFKLGGSDSVFKTKTFQASWNLGIGIELAKHLQIQASYAWGMNNVFKYKIPEENLSGDIKGKNNYWTVTAAWLF